MPRASETFVTRARCTGLGAALLLLTLAVDAVAQAWTPAPGHLYAKLSFGSTNASEQFAFDGQEADFITGVTGNAFRDRSLYLYTEWGLSDDLALVVTLPYKRTIIRDQAFRYRTRAFGSAMVGLRASLRRLLGWQDTGHALAANVALTLPTGYTRNLAPSAGAGQVDAQATLAYGRSLYPLPAYAQLSGGYRYRSAVYAFSRAVDCNVGSDLNCTTDQQPDPGEELVYSFEAGLTPLGGGLLLQLLGNGVWSVVEPTEGFTAINPIPTRQRYFKLGGGGAVYPFRLAGVESLAPLGLSVQYFETVSGRNTIRSRDLFVGLEYQRTLF